MAILKRRLISNPQALRISLRNRLENPSDAPVDPYSHRGLIADYLYGVPLSESQSRELERLLRVPTALARLVSISPAHDDMAKAKDEYLLKVHSEYRDIHEEVLRKLEPDELMGPEEYKRLSGLYELYDRVNSMAVWPLDFQTMIRFAITSILPILSIGISFSITL